MTINEFSEFMKSCPFPVYWNHVSSEIKPPYVVWYSDETDNDFRDDLTYNVRPRFTLEFYSRSQGYDSNIQTFEDFLTPLCWNKTGEAWLDEYKVTQHVYEAS